MRTLSLTYGPTSLLHFRRMLCSSRAMCSNHHPLLALQSIIHSIDVAPRRVSSCHTRIAVIQFHSMLTCYAFFSDGDGNGKFELSFHAITVARLSMYISGSLLDENSDSVEGKGLSCCYFVLHARPQHDLLVCGVAWLVQLCLIKRIVFMCMVNARTWLVHSPDILGRVLPPRARPRLLKRHFEFTIERHTLDCHLKHGDNNSLSCWSWWYSVSIGYTPPST